MGGKKGGGGHTPYEAPDNLKSAQRLSAIGLISLGPIRGAVTADQYQSAFFDYTPIKNSKGEWNYQNTLIRYRLGYQDQQPLEDFDASEREVSVGAEVKLEHPIARTVIDPDVDRLRITLGVNALFSQNDQGDTHGTSVHLEILINGQSRQTVVINGKSSSRFHRSYLIDNLPPRPFTVTVRRVTPDSKSQRLQNATFWSSYTEIISTKLSYPNMAIVGIKTDSRYNPSFPNINFLLYGRLVKVPSNYDPDTRTYGSGLWRGDFKLAWTNNPAWVFYDLVTNKLAGLGQRLGDYGIDKFQLYQIAQYCDQQVPDGYGGVEPRMVANLWLTEQRDAYSVISDMASVFRAIVVWNGTQLTAIQDRNADPVCSFTQANVIDGKFNRQYVPLKSIFTAVEVEYADERNNYQKAIEYVADDAMIKRYGYNVKKIVAFACTSRGQARRYGKWVLETSRLEQCTISFSVGREGLQVLPGDIIEIADKSYANVNLGGRVLAINGRTVTLDAPIEVAGEKYLSYLVNDNNGQRLVRRKISQINAQNKSLVTLDSEPTGLQVMDTWALHTPLVSTQRYRVLGVAENEDGSYGITALQHEPQK
ncbi:phage tail protein, partial [Glaesserella parasuis]|nr:phage tail protein [Glaesserella parasuis]MDP0290510.1 phage tail protein [Glaesserella parasuis]MDP0292631.1 phage tail protein [Glaesserella parasuis]MDP0296817.1 phage tail protein [Glaesserella parasuis]MDP0301125.1 phage tail protein [Glaesserella parasuis]